ncbi:hypothetical protein KIN20_016308 [Parelaphostrongylus tenuis]|uniref:Uncharacterized protein n=1 Tax=Parelaphostrongylus tenuis TaxID=148309 RepID=A0AAD5ML34_PARTN|nr:hypothetical protein KIN20_016308 [Parelaphostrongylus tenuis]
MAIFPISYPLIISVSTFATIWGCGVLPSGQASNRNFTVTGLTLPVNMVYSTDAAVRVKTFGVAESSNAI